MKNENMEQDEQSAEESSKINNEDQGELNNKKLKIALISTASFLFLAGFVVLAMLAVYPRFETEDEIGSSENSSKEGVSENDMQQSVENNFFERASEACKWKRNLSGNFEPGTVFINFEDDISAKEIKIYLEENNMKISSGYHLETPTDVIIEWKDEFLRSNEITIDEINDFYRSILNEDYIENVNPYYLHSSSPIDMGGIKHDLYRQGDKIDRWGYFIIRFSDPAKMPEFWQKYPEATRYDESEVRGSGYRDYVGREVIVMYKAEEALRVLRKVKSDLGLEEGVRLEDIDGSETARSFIDLERQLSEPPNSEWINTAFSINMPSDYLNNETVEFLGNYNEIDPSKTIIEGRLNFATVKVPENYEECWADQLETEPGVTSAFLNYYASFN